MSPYIWNLKLQMPEMILPDIQTYSSHSSIHRGLIKICMNSKVKSPQVTESRTYRYRRVRGIPGKRRDPAGYQRGNVIYYGGHGRPRVTEPGAPRSTRGTHGRKNAAHFETKGFSVTPMCILEAFLMFTLTGS